MIAFRNNNSVYFTFPTSFQRRLTQAELDFRGPENDHIWQLDDGLGTIVMVQTKSTRALDLIKYSNVFDVDLTHAGMQTARENIKELLENSNCIIKDGGPGVAFCIARGNKCLCVGFSGASFELMDFEMYDDFDELFLPILERTKEVSDPYERIRKIYSMAEELDASKYFPVVVIDSNGGERKIIER